MSNAIRDFLDQYAGGKTKSDELSAAAVADMLGEYEKAYNEILVNLNKTFASGDFGKVAVQTALLKQIGAIIDKMSGGMTHKLTNAIVEISKESAKTAIEHMNLFDKKIAEGDFIGKYDEKYVKTQFADSFAHIAAHTDKMHATAKELIRSEAKKVYQAATVKGLTPYAAAKELYKNVTTIDPGFVFVDKAGRKWDTKNYLKMLTHTVLANASIEAYIDEAAKNGQDLFMVSRHNTTCPKCKPWESRVVSNTGITPGYPKLAEAKGSGLFHPRCQHRLLVYHKEIHDFMASPDAKKGMTNEQKREVADGFHALAEKKQKARVLSEAKTAENQYFGVVARKLENPNSSITFDKTYPLDGKGMSLGGVPFKHTGPVDFSKIKDVEGIEPGAPTIPSGKKLSCGVLVVEDDGRIWLCEPKNHFGGYQNTFAKGGHAPGYTRQQTAIKEAYEELGLNVEITGFLGDYEKTTSLTRYFIARRVGGDPTKAHWESEYVKLVTADEAKKILNTDVDQKILEDFLKKGPAEQEALDAAYKVTKKQGKLIAENGMKWALEFENKLAASLKTGSNLIEEKVWEEINKKAEALGTVANLSKSKTAKAAAQAAHQKLSAMIKATEPYMMGMSPLTQTVEALNSLGLLKRKLDFESAGVKVTPEKKDPLSILLEEGAKAEAELKAKTKGPDLSKLKYQPGTQGGSNMGGVYLDGNEKYYGKFYQNPDQGKVEEITNAIYRKFGLGAPETYWGQFTAPTGELKYGVATKYVEGLTKFDYTDPQFAFELAKFHVVSALVNNWDVVGMGYDNLLKTKAGKMFVVDSGGSFWFRAQGGPKAFGKDIDSFFTLMDPSVNHYAASVFKGVHDNYTSKKPVAYGLLKWFRESMADGSIEKLVGESIGYKHLSDGTALEVFKHRAQLLERKLEEYANGKPKAAAKPKPVEPKVTRSLEAQEKALDEVLPKVRPAGATYRRDSDQIEDQAVRFWREKTYDGQELSVARLKLTKAGDAAFMEKLSEAIREASGAGADKKLEEGIAKMKDLYKKVWETVSLDKGFDKDGKYGPGVMQVVETAKSEFEAINKKYGLDKKMGLAVTQTSSMLSMVDWVVKNDVMPNISAYNLEKLEKAIADSASSEKGKTALQKGVRVGDLEIKLIETRPNRKVVKDGVLVELDEELDLTTDYRRFRITDKKTGMVIEYRPRITEDGVDTLAHLEMKKTGTTSNAYATEMEMVVKTKGPLSTQTRDGILETLSRQWGVNTAKTSVHDAELMYLKQGLYIRKLDKESWATFILNSENYTPEEKVRHLKTQIEKRMGIKLPETPSEDGKNPHKPGHYYDPFGRSLVASEAQGYNVKMRWDVDKREFDKIAAGKTLVHATKANLPELVWHLLNGGGNTTPTAERVLRGIPTTGASPQEDMRTGGASYFFVTVADKKSSDAYSPSQYGDSKFFFKREAMLRVDAISYNRDRYGAVRPDSEIQMNRIVDPKEYPDKIFYSPGNETILKGGLSIIDDIEFVLCETPSDRDSVISTYKHFGYSVLPDGRKIEDVVKYNPGANYGQWRDVLSAEEKG